MKVHLKKSDDSGSRSACRYSARPSRQLWVMSAQDFAGVPTEQRCSECDRKYRIRIRRQNENESPKGKG